MLLLLLLLTYSGGLGLGLGGGLYNTQPLILIVEETFWRGVLLFNSNTKLISANSVYFS